MIRNKLLIITLMAFFNLNCICAGKFNFLKINKIAVDENLVDEVDKIKLDEFLNEADFILDFYEEEIEEYLRTHDEKFFVFSILGKPRIPALKTEYANDLAKIRLEEISFYENQIFDFRKLNH